ncbi:MAG: hypothetical protein GY874_03755 [Desulfobacteraceae bacterium]|nr:hypothetical protein [Desulfobacteraceae bacterium]
MLAPQGFWDGCDGRLWLYDGLLVFVFLNALAEISRASLETADVGCPALVPALLGAVFVLSMRLATVFRFSGLTLLLIPTLGDGGTRTDTIREMGLADDL